jgi:hypothetical protein
LKEQWEMAQRYPWVWQATTSQTNRSPTGHKHLQQYVTGNVCGIAGLLGPEGYNYIRKRKQGCNIAFELGYSEYVLGGMTEIQGSPKPSQGLLIRVEQGLEKAVSAWEEEHGEVGGLLCIRNSVTIEVCVWRLCILQSFVDRLLSNLHPRSIAFSCSAFFFSRSLSFLDLRF